MAGFNADGSFEPRTLAEILAGFEARERANIDAALDVSLYSPVGQLNAIMASELASLWELAEELHDAIDPDRAVGDQQDALYSLTGTLRRGETASSVVATVVLQPGADIVAGVAQASVFGSATAKFVNTVSMANPTLAPITIPVAYHSIATGPVIAPAGTLTVIDSPQSGWTSITNALDADPGTLVESSSAFRRRRELELAAQGGVTVPGLRADLLRLDTVHAASVIENYSWVQVGDLPPKSLEAVVRSAAGAGDEQTIADTIWSNKATGIETVGNQPPLTVTDEEGVAHAIHFSRPVERTIYVALRLLTDPLHYPGDAVTRQALVDASEDPAAVGYLDVGADVYAGRLVAAAMALPGVVNAEARLSFDPITSFDAASTSLVITQREIAGIDTGRIAIGAFP